jgi:hypothetical protein
MKTNCTLSATTVVAALVSVLAFVGCSTGGLKVSDAPGTVQTAGSKEVILVPIVIFSPPGENSRGNSPAPPIAPGVPEQSIQGQQHAPSRPSEKL